MDITTLRDFDDHELVLLARDADSGLTAVIAVHSTVAGPACGGTRMWAYATHEEAVIDALRLSRGMTYKNIMAGLPLGGGKSVIIGNARTDKSDALLRAFGRKVEALGGRYIAAEDVGTSPADMALVGQETRHVAGLTGGAGDPSPFTAFGVYHGIKATAQELTGTADLKGLKIAVQGLGHVGQYLCQHLAAEGAQLIVADLDSDKVAEQIRLHGATAVDAGAIHAADCDIYAPCALGATVNARSIPEIRAKAIAGAANNQLSVPEMAAELARRGILYAPDYVINAGGIISVSAEVTGTFDHAAIMARSAAIGDTVSSIFARAKATGATTADVADMLAQEKLAALKAAGPAQGIKAA